ncbi:hypothetical protein ACFCYX_06240 [Streptomyces populi]|uniref:hypothetical protein n=1 Tax=Streptomyces populi TaxID=2058924 RepID=UPI0026CBF304
MSIRPWDSALDHAELPRRRPARSQPEDDHASVEPGRPPYGRIPTGIRGLRLAVTEVRAKPKYDDHKPVGRRAGTARRLTGRDTGPDTSTAARQLRRLDRTGPWKP